MLDKLFKWSRNHTRQKAKTGEAEEYDSVEDGEFEVPNFTPAEIKMSVELMCRRREEILRMQYGATKAYEDEIL